MLVVSRIIKFHIKFNLALKSPVAFPATGAKNVDSYSRMLSKFISRKRAVSADVKIGRHWQEGHPEVVFTFRHITLETLCVN